MAIQALMVILAVLLALLFSGRAHLVRHRRLVSDGHSLVH